MGIAAGTAAGHLLPGAGPAGAGAEPAGAAPPCAPPSSPDFFSLVGENIIWPIRCSRLTEDCVYLIRPPGGMSFSDPPGASDRYLSPSSPAETISATVSSGSLIDWSMLICTSARKVFGSRSADTTEPTLMPLM